MLAELESLQAQVDEANEITEELRGGDAFEWEFKAQVRRTPIPRYEGRRPQTLKGPEGQEGGLSPETSACPLEGVWKRRPWKGMFTVKGTRSESSGASSASTSGESSGASSAGGD